MSDTITITVELPLDAVRRDAVKVFEDSFQGPRYSDAKGGGGHEIVKRVVEAEIGRAVLAANVSGMVRAAVAAQVAGVVAAVVGDELTRAVRAEVKRLAKDGTINKAAQATLLEER